MNRAALWLLPMLLLASCSDSDDAGGDGTLLTPGAADTGVAAEEDTFAPPEDTTPEDTGPGPRPIPAPTFVEAQGRRVVAIGDVHGDMASTRSALKLAGAIDDQDNWIGGDLIVVQVGDQLDRGADEQAILDMLERLSDEAHAAGGGLYPLLGNHEVMNVELDLRYVFDGGWEDFAEFAEGADPNDPDLVGQPMEYWGRIIAFRPGGPYAQLLAGHNIAMVVGDTLFVHGGILPEHLSFDLESINADTRSWMLGQRDQPLVLVQSDSPVWSRHYSRDTTEADCQLLSEVLASASVSRMVVAHSVQDEGINSACGGTVWRVDVGLADYYGGPTQVLEILDGDVKVVSE